MRGVDQQHVGAAVGEDVRQPRGREARVQRHVRPAAGQRGEQPDDRGRAVPAQQRHRPAPPPQRPGPPPRWRHGRAELAVGQLPVVGEHRGTVRMARDLRGERGRDVGLGGLQRGRASRRRSYADSGSRSTVDRPGSAAITASSVARSARKTRPAPGQPHHQPALPGSPATALGELAVPSARPRATRWHGQRSRRWSGQVDAHGRAATACRVAGVAAGQQGHGRAAPRAPAAPRRRAPAGQTRGQPAQGSPRPSAAAQDRRRDLLTVDTSASGSHTA